MKAPAHIDFSDKVRTTTVKDANIKAALYWLPGRNMAYKVWYNGALLFAGDDYKPSPLMSCDSKESIMSLLAFIAVQPGDTDDSYFDNYTPEQLAFANSYDAEKLGYAVSEYEEKQYAKAK